MCEPELEPEVSKPVLGPLDLPLLRSWHRADMGVSGSGASLSLSDQSGNGRALYVLSGVTEKSELSHGGLPSIRLTGRTVLGFEGDWASVVFGQSHCSCYLLIVLEVVTNLGRTQSLLGAFSTLYPEQRFALTFNKSHIVAEQSSGHGEPRLINTLDPAIVGTTLVLELAISGEDIALWCNGYQLHTDTSALSGRSLVVHRGTIGATSRDGELDQFANIRVAEVIACGVVPTRQQRRDLRMKYWWPRYIHYDRELTTAFSVTSFGGNNANTNARQWGLFTSGDTQHVCWIDQNDRVIVGSRLTSGKDWEVAATKFAPAGAASASEFSGSPSDNHNEVALIVDGAGYLHVNGGVHARPMRHARSVEPGLLNILSPSGPLVKGADDEDSVTYPQFVRTKGGDLLLFYRDGESGRGDAIIKRLDHSRQEWSTIQSPLIEGDTESAYLYRVVLDSKQRLHIVFSWRETGAHATAHDICYAMSPDYGVRWYQDPQGLEEQRLPITLDNARVIKAIPKNSLLRERAALCTDDSDNPIACTMWANNPGGPHLDSQYHVLRWDPETHEWNDHEVGGLRGDLGSDGAVKPAILARKGECLVVFSNNERQGIWMARSSDFVEWKHEQLYTKSVGSRALAQLDDARWLQDGILSAYVQFAGGPSTPPQCAGVVELVEIEGGRPVHELAKGTNVLAAWRCDRSNLVLGQLGATRLNDLTGGGRHFVSDAGVDAQPTFAPVAGPNHAPILSGDAVRRGMVSPLSLERPSVTPFFVWVVFRLNTETLRPGRVLLGGADDNVLALRLGEKSEMFALNGGSPDWEGCPVVAGQWFLLEAFFSNSADDYLRIGAHAVTAPSSFGNEFSRDGIGLFATTRGTSQGDCAIAEMFVATAVPSNLEELKDAAVSKYGDELIAY